MWQIMQELAAQREREMAALTRSSLFTHHPATEPPRADRSRRARVRLPQLAFDKWPYLATRSDPAQRNGAAGAAEAC